jgi:hypothetical protein
MEKGQNRLYTARNVPKRNNTVGPSVGWLEN